MNFSIDADGDLEIVDGEVQLVTGQREIEQFLKQKFKTIVGTWFLDLTLGIDYFGKILVKQVNPSIINAIFIDVIVQTTGIKELIEFDLNFEAATRKLLVTFKATTFEDDLIIFEETVP